VGVRGSPLRAAERKVAKEEEKREESIAARRRPRHEKGLWVGSGLPYLTKGAAHVLREPGTFMYAVEQGTEGILAARIKV
jgi:hypothetical protein